jgi:hypothetical protein
MVRSVFDFKPTELIASITAMNAGTDFKAQKLRQPTALCVGAAVDLNRPAKEEAALTIRKVEAGAQFLVTQLVFRVDQIRGWLDACQELTGRPLELPVFYGLPVLEKDSLVYGEMPDVVRRDLDAGRPGADIALEQYRAFRERGIRGFYVIPPILRTGARNYNAAHDFLSKARNHRSGGEV